MGCIREQKEKEKESYVCASGGCVVKVMNGEQKEAKG